MHLGYAIALIVLALGLGLVVGYFIRVKRHEKTIAKSKHDSEKIIAEAEAEAEKKKKESKF